MKTNWKPFVYKKRTDAALDAEFERANSYGRVRLGETMIFWELGFRWYAVHVNRIERVYRRVEDTLTQIGCRPGVVGIQKLILILDDEIRLELQIGEGNKEETAEALYTALQGKHPQLKYGIAKSD